MTCRSWFNWVLASPYPVLVIVCLLATAYACWFPDYRSDSADRPLVGSLIEYDSRFVNPVQTQTIQTSLYRDKSGYRVQVLFSTVAKILWGNTNFPEVTIRLIFTDVDPTSCSLFQSAGEEPTSTSWATEKYGMTDLKRISTDGWQLRTYTRELYFNTIIALENHTYAEICSVKLSPIHTSFAARQVAFIPPVDPTDQPAPSGAHYEAEPNGDVQLFISDASQVTQASGLRSIPTNATFYPDVRASHIVQAQWTDDAFQRRLELLQVGATLLIALAAQLVFELFRPLLLPPAKAAFERN